MRRLAIAITLALVGGAAAYFLWLDASSYDPALRPILGGDAYQLAVESSALESHSTSHPEWRAILEPDKARSLQWVCTGHELVYPQDFWRPSPVHVAQIEAQLPKHFAKVQYGPRNTLSSFVRQYVGVVDNGRKLVCLNALASFIVESRIRLCLALPPQDAARNPSCQNLDDWRRDPLEVKDGGDGFWRILYDPSTGTFSGYNQNGCPC